jgi:hypothetical protein
MRQVPPYMHKVKASETAWISAGSYDISKWFRPIFPSYILWEGETEVSIVKDEPDTYLQFETNKKIIDRCIEKGVFTDWFLFASQCMRIAPPLIMTEEEIRSSCATILECCDAFYQN